MSSFSEDVKTVSRKFRDIDKIKQKQRKFPYIKHCSHRPFGNRIVLAQCVKPYAGLECQAFVGGTVFCMAENPCWRVEK